MYTLYANFTKDNNLKGEVGKKAPDFVLYDMNGEEHRLSDYEGKRVLLNLWAGLLGVNLVREKCYIWIANMKSIKIEVFKSLQYRGIRRCCK